MEENIFRDWSNNYKYIQQSYQGNIARIGHLEFLNQRLTRIIDELTPGGGGGGATAWGTITGTLTDQTDLKGALNLKADKIIKVEAIDGIEGGGTLASDMTIGLSKPVREQLALANTAVQPVVLGNYVPTGRVVSSGTGLTGGGALSSNQTIALNATSIASLAKADTAVQPAGIANKADKATTISAGTGLTGGGDIGANRTIALNQTSIDNLALASTSVQPSALTGYVPTTRTVTTGAGLTGGGALSTNQSIALNSASIASLAKAETAVQPSALEGYIPLTGTEIDNPITGDLQFKKIESRYEPIGFYLENGLSLDTTRLDFFVGDMTNSTIFGRIVSEDTYQGIRLDNSNPGVFTIDTSKFGEQASFSLDPYGLVMSTYVTPVSEVGFVQKKYVDGEAQQATASSGAISSNYAKNTFIYKGTTDADYDLPPASDYFGIEIFIMNKSTNDLTITGDIWDVGAQTSKVVEPTFGYYLISDGETWNKY